MHPVSIPLRGLSHIAHMFPNQASSFSCAIYVLYPSIRDTNAAIEALVEVLWMVVVTEGGVGVPRFEYTDTKTCHIVSLRRVS